MEYNIKHHYITNNSGRDVNPKEEVVRGRIREASFWLVSHERHGYAPIGHG